MPPSNIPPAAKTAAKKPEPPKPTEPKKSCCNQGALKCIIIVFNILFLLFGGAVLTIGAFTLSGFDKVALDGGEVLEKISDIGTLAGLNDTRAAPDGKLKLDASILSQDVGIALVVIGSVMVLLSAEGFLSVGEKVIGALIFYDVCVCLFLLIQLILVIGFFAGMIGGLIRGRMQDMIKQDYKGIDDYKPQSLLWNFIMIKFECCGVVDYEDFSNARKWRNQRQFVDAGDVALSWPIACCQMNNDYSAFRNISCVQGLDEGTSNINDGCYDAIVKYLQRFKVNAIVIIVIVLVLQLVLIMITSFLIKMMRKEKDEEEQGPGRPYSRREFLKVAPAAQQNQAVSFL